MCSVTPLKELEESLPNGFHDAVLETMSVDFLGNTLVLDMELSTGDPDAPSPEGRDSYRKAVVRIRDLVYVSVEPPGPDGELSDTRTVVS